MTDNTGKYLLIVYDFCELTMKPYGMSSVPRSAIGNMAYTSVKINKPLNQILNSKLRAELMDGLYVFDAMIYNTEDKKDKKIKEFREKYDGSKGYGYIHIHIGNILTDIYNNNKTTMTDDEYKSLLSAAEEYEPGENSDMYDDDRYMNN